MGIVLGFGTFKQPCSLDIGLEHDVDQGFRAVGCFLGQPSDAISRWHLDIAVLSGDVSGDDIKERALAGAVTADEADAGAVRDAHRCALDQQPAGNPDREIVDDKHGALYGRGGIGAQSPAAAHGCILRPEGAMLRVPRAYSARRQPRRAIMCVPGCQEALRSALSRRGFFAGAAAAGFAATAVAPAEAAPRKFRAVVDLTHTMSPEFPTF